jgi:hypothetical protein
MTGFHHINGVNPCPNCEQKLTEADPALGVWFRKIKAEFPTAHISWSYRDRASQEQAFTEGKTKLHFPNSPHNFVGTDSKPCAKALDLFNLSEDGIATFPPPFYAKIWQRCCENKDPIKWGGTFKTLGDADHFQLV